MLDLSCQDGLHSHYWHDTTFNRDFMVPETFIIRLQQDLVEPLKLATEALQRAQEAVESTSEASVIITDALQQLTELEALDAG